MAKCASCGRDNRDRAGYCAWCGATLQADAAAQGDVGVEPNAIAPMADEDEGGSAQPSEMDEAWEQAAEEGDELFSEADVDGLASNQGKGEPDVEQAPSYDEVDVDAGDVEAGAGAAGAAGAERSKEGALQPGEVLKGRYEIIEIIDPEASRTVYRARDLGDPVARCGACGFDGNAPDDAFCGRCGASLDLASLVTVVEQVRQPPESYDEMFQEGERDYYVRFEPQATSAPQSSREESVPLRLIVGHATDTGRQRKVNEDALDAWVYTRSNGATLGLFVVADGLGGQDSGEIASRLAVDTVWGALREMVWEPLLRGAVMPPEEIEGCLSEATRAANRAVYEERIERGSEMSTTLTMTLVLASPTNGSPPTAYIANVGDSRTYVLGVGGLNRITRDHSLVQRLVDTGKIRPEEVYTHPQRNLIYQSIGDRPDLQVDTFRHKIEPDDRLILCSDGLWEMVRDEGIEEVLLAELDPQRACDQLVHHANLAGGEDNISVIIVHAQSRTSGRNVAAWHDAD
jgi:serine/threonine protein phosphatase PrpC